MKHILLSLLLLSTILTSCEVANDKNTLLGTSNLPLDSYTIDVTRDTVLTTKRGAIINIPAGSIEAKGNTVTLNIREAFSIADIVKAGLVTESDGEPLSSGGMIYINAGEENGAKVVKEIAVSIPTDYLQEGMQLYKGEEKEDGSVNWVQPEALKEDTVTDRIAKGKEIYNTNCSSCHHPFTESTGPALAGITQLRSKHFLNRFIRNSALMISGGGSTPEEYEEDHLAECLYYRYGKTAMTAFPDLTDDELNMLYEYLENEGNKIGIGEKIKKCNDSCRIYFSLLEGLGNRRWDMIAEGEPRIELNYFDGDSQLIIPRALIPPTEEKVMPAYNNATYYKFNIDAFGWYNIDMLLASNNDFVKSRLAVSVEGNSNPDVFLAVPDRKIFQQGGYMNGNDGKFAFDNSDGTVPLPQGLNAYIIAVSERDGKIFFGAQSFTTSIEQDIKLIMTVISKQEFDDKIANLDFTGVDIKIKKTKNADSLLIIDKQLKNLELLRPKNCDCDCKFDNYLRQMDTVSTE